MGYVRVELEHGRKQFDLSENWSESWTLDGRDMSAYEPLRALDALVAKVKAAYEAGS